MKTKKQNKKPFGKFNLDILKAFGYTKEDVIGSKEWKQKKEKIK